MSAQTQSSTIAKGSTREWSKLAALLHNPWLWVAGMTVLGFALRRYHLGSESLWFDEADIVAQARQPLSALIEGFTKAGENGPLYTLTLHYWLAIESGVPGAARLMNVLFGSSMEAHMRGLSMIFGTAAIPAIFVFAKRLGGIALGVVSAALLTINPFHLWYSQDAKMYSLLVLMTIITTILYLRAIERNTILSWAAYIIATWVMLTAHSLAGLVLLAQILAAPVLLRRTIVRVPLIDGRPTTGGEGESTDSAPPAVSSEESMSGTRTIVGRRSSVVGRRSSAIGLLFSLLIILAPIFPIAWLRVAAIVTGTVDTGNWYTNASLPDVLVTLFVKFAVNQAATSTVGGIAIPWETIGALSMAALAIAGVVGMRNVGYQRPRPEGTRDDRPPKQPISGAKLFHIPHSKFRIPSIPHSAFRIPHSEWLILLLWLVPVVVFWLVTLIVPLFQPRYLIMALPPYLIMAAGGVLTLGRIRPGLAGVPLALLGLATGAAMLTINYSPTPQKEDWRGAMVYVQDHLRSYDAIVVFPGYLESAVKLYYTPGGAGHVPDRPVSTVPSLITHNYGFRELEADLRQIATCNQRAWLIVSPVREDQEDPQHQVQQWFQYNFHTFDTQQFNGVTVYGVTFNGQPNCWYPGPDTNEPYTYQNGLIMVGYTYQLRGLINYQKNPKLTQPDASYFPLTLYWRTNSTKFPDYNIEVTIRGPSGKVVDQTLGPDNGYWPSSQWPLNDNVLDYRDLRLPGGLKPGNYKVSVRIFPTGHPDQPLKLQDGSTEIVLKQPLPVVPWKP